jgi:hypothetical protein
MKRKESLEKRLVKYLETLAPFATPEVALKVYFGIVW